AEPKQKKVRGETTLASYIGKSKPKEKVNFDDSGKVNGDNQTRFSDTIGVLLKQSRRFVWHDHWDVQPNEAKDRLWAELE
ncbi:hypothetical protein MKW94_008342, partial [Papaver nudicaule]|nr:hypothetical protein [Papaver nudicaule]